MDAFSIPEMQQHEEEQVITFDEFARFLRRAAYSVGRTTSCNGIKLTWPDHVMQNINSARVDHCNEMSLSGRIVEG